MKKILIVYPHNPLKPSSGINRRYHSLIQYLHNRGFQIDILSLRNYVDTWDGQETDSGSFINQVFQYNFTRGKSYDSIVKKLNIPGRLFRRLRYPETIFHRLPDYAFFGMKQLFKRIIKTNNYSHILISYVQWANLVDPNIHQHHNCILDISDFQTQQLFETTNGKVNVGRLVTEEINRVDRFSQVMCIAPQEKWFFFSFTTKPNYYHIPHFIDPPPLTYASVQRYDLLFVGANNPANVTGIRWFLEEIHPLLPEEIKILIVGEISRHIPRHKNIEHLSHAKDLDAIYTQAKIAICPLLTGTGLKIKVVEALANGLPVVTTTRGLAGFEYKTNNGCLIADSPSQFTQHINVLLKEKRLYQKLSQLGRTYFREHFSNESIYPRLDEIFSS